MVQFAVAIISYIGKQERQRQQPPGVMMEVTVPDADRSDDSVSCVSMVTCASPSGSGLRFPTLGTQFLEVTTRGGCDFCREGKRDCRLGT